MDVLRTGARPWRQPAQGRHGPPRADIFARDLQARINAFDFDTVGRRTARFGRADRALFAAKENGRDRIEVR